MPGSVLEATSVSTGGDDTACAADSSSACATVQQALDISSESALAEVTIEAGTHTLASAIVWMPSSTDLSEDCWERRPSTARLSCLAVSRSK